MSILVILKLGKGDWLQGFPHVSLQLWETENAIPIQLTGSLPPNQELQQLYQQWRNLYQGFADFSSFRSSQYRQDQGEIIFDEEDVLQFSQEEFLKVCEQLKYSFNQWFNYPDFNRIESHLRTALHPSDSIRLIVETENESLRRFPWHLWHFFADYPQAEMALSPQEYQRVKTISRKYRSKVRILAILGHSDGLDLKAERILWEKLPEAEVTFLVAPKRRELDRCLWDERGWDILFFAGHSTTKNEGKIGYLAINSENTISLVQLKNALKQAINRGLQLAIFNSCDGLGLAQQLACLSIPQIIVMRQPVPDLVAQEFFQDFLTAFRNGQSFYASVREARERLQALEDEFPCASWLPVICQNPAVNPRTWQQLCKIPQGTRKKVLYPLITSFVITIFVVGMRMFGLWLEWEQNAVNGLLRLRPHEKQDSRILMVIATPEDIKTQSIKPQGKASLSDHTLSLLLKKLQQQYQPITIGLDIYRDFPVDSTNLELIKYLKQNNIFGICKVKSLLDGDTEGIAPPGEISEKQIGFADFVADTDKVVRRHLLAMSPSSDATDSCLAVNSFSLLIALHYLQEKHQIDFDYTATGELKIGDIVLHELETYFGSYRRVDTGGRQILLNYRALDSPREIATTIQIKDIIEDKIPPSRLSQLQGKIVLIGIADSPTTSADYWPTPFSATQVMDQKEIPGVFIQAQMVSQLISAVLDQRSLLWFMPWWGDFFWIWSWCLTASLLKRFGLLQIEVTVLLMSGLNYGFGYLILLRGGLMPVIPSIIALVMYSFIDKIINKKIN